MPPYSLCSSLLWSKVGLQGPHGWRISLGHCIASCATRDSGFAPRLCRSWPRPGGPWGRRTIGLASSGLGTVWPVGISVAGWAQCALTKVARCTVFPPTHWCGWLPGWRRAVLRSSVVGLCFRGRMAFDLCLSRARKGVVAMRQDSSNNWIPRNWGEKGVKKK